MKNSCQKLFKIIILLLTFVSGIQSQCAIDIRTDLYRTTTAIREPVFLKFSGNQYQLMIPDNGILNFASGESASIACIADTKANVLTINAQPSATITCLSGKVFTLNNQLYDIALINECSTSITGTTLNRNQNCGSDGTFINIGYQFNGQFVNLIDICYSKVRGSAIYSAHTVQGNTIVNAMKTSTRPSIFKTSEVPSNIAPATSFTKASQLVRLTSLIGSTKAEEYMNKTYLARGHLAPDGDMVFVSWQWTTYYYINVIPQWQSVNNGNWKVVENSIRARAAALNYDLRVFTGSFEVLELDGKLITLEAGGIEVPRWSWKVVKDTQNGKGIAFVTSNNPFATSVPNVCADICDENGWNWAERKSIYKGYTICCDVIEIMDIIFDIPTEAYSDGILQDF